MKKLKTKEQMKFYRKYHIPGCGNLMSVKQNAIFINRHNSIEHERKKFDLAWVSEVFLTEAERSASEDEVRVFNLKRKRKIIDFVDLISMSEWEIIHKHESDEQIAFYRKTGIIPVIIGKTILCEKCRLIYPRRNKTNICSICRTKDLNSSSYKKEIG